MKSKIIIGGICGVIGYEIGKEVTLKRVIKYLKSDEMIALVDDWINKNLSKVYKKKEEA